MLRREKHREALVAALLMLQDLAYPRARDGRDCLQTRLCLGGFVHSSGQSWLRRRRRRHIVSAGGGRSGGGRCGTCVRTCLARVLEFLPLVIDRIGRFPKHTTTHVALKATQSSIQPRVGWHKLRDRGIERSRLVVEVEEHRDDLNSAREVVQLVSRARS